MILEINIKNKIYYTVVYNKDDILEALKKYTENYMQEEECDELIEDGTFENATYDIYCALYYNIVEINRTIKGRFSDKLITNTNFFIDNSAKL